MKQTLIMNKRVGKAVSQHTKEGMFIKTYPTVKDAATELSLNRKSIHHTLSGRTKTSGGFIWKYAENTQPKDQPIL
jgi:hypothetical protein